MTKTVTTDGNDIFYYTGKNDKMSASQVDALALWNEGSDGIWNGVDHDETSGGSE